MIPCMIGVEEDSSIVARSLVAAAAAAVYAIEGLLDVSPLQGSKEHSDADGLFRNDNHHSS